MCESRTECVRACVHLVRIYWTRMRPPRHTVSPHAYYNLNGERAGRGRFPAQQSSGRQTSASAHVRVNIYNGFRYKFTAVCACTRAGGGGEDWLGRMYSLQYKVLISYASRQVCRVACNTTRYMFTRSEQVLHAQYYSSLCSGGGPLARGEGVSGALMMGARARACARH